MNFEHAIQWLDKNYYYNQQIDSVEQNSNKNTNKRLNILINIICVINQRLTHVHNLEKNDINRTEFLAALDDTLRQNAVFSRCYMKNIANELM